MFCRHNPASYYYDGILGISFHLDLCFSRLDNKDDGRTFASQRKLTFSKKH